MSAGALWRRCRIVANRSSVAHDSRCLMQSVVLVAMLARRGAEASLVIGVRPGVDFGAHAWVELAGRALLPTFGDDFARLVEL